MAESQQVASLHASIGAKTTEFKTGAQQVKTGLRELEGNFRGLQQVGSGALDGLGMSIGRFAGPVGVGLAIVETGKLAFRLGQLGTQSDQLGRRLRGVAGGSTAAAQTMAAMRDAADGGLSKLQAMAYGSQFLSMGLADTAQEAGTLARMALVLGNQTQNAAERMDNWALMLANNSVERLDSFGISSGRVRARIDELMAANDQLGRSEAFVQAVLEIGAESMAKLEAAGVEATTAVDQFNAAWEDLKVSAGEKISPTIEVIVKWGAGQVQEAAFALSDEGAIEQRYAEAFDNYRRAVERTNQAKAALAGWYAQINPLARANYEVQVQEAEAAEAAALAAYQLAAGLQDVALNGADTVESLAEVDHWMRRIAGAQPAAQAALTGFLESQALDWQKTLAGQSYQGGLQDYYSSFLPPGAERAWAQIVNTDAVNQQQAGLRALGDTAVSAGRRAQTAWENAFENAERKRQGLVQGFLREGIQASINLGVVDGGGGKPNAPGQNGAFEALYRIQAGVLNDDEQARQWLSMYGLDKEAAKGITSKFQQGIFDESVLQFVDKGKLSEQLQLAQLAEATQAALVDELAKTSGAQPEIIKGLLGLGGKGEGGEGVTATGEALKPAVDSLVTGLQTEIAAQAVQIAAQGGAFWTAFETGIIAQAKTSGALKAAVSEMVYAALAEGLPDA